MRLFYKGPAISADLLVMMLEKNGITGVMEPLDPDDGADPDDVNRMSKVSVSDEDFPRAHQLFYAEREDEL